MLRAAQATARKKTQDVLDAVAAKLPAAMVSLDEISNALALPPIEAIPLITRAEEQCLIKVWETDQDLYCCLSEPEAGRRGLQLKAPGQTYRKRKDGTIIEFTVAELAGQYRWTVCLLPPGDRGDYQRADGTRLPRKKKPAARPRIIYQRQAEGMVVGTIAAEEMPADRDIDHDESDVTAFGRIEAEFLRKEAAFRRAGHYAHHLANDDPMDVEPTASEGAIDGQRRTPPLKWPTKGVCPYLERFSGWPKKKPWPRWLRRYMSNPWPTGTGTWEIYFHLLRLAKRSFKPRPLARGYGHPPGILLGLAHLSWKRDCERDTPCRNGKPRPSGVPCPVCGDRPLSPMEACLGCGRSGSEGASSDVY